MRTVTRSVVAGLVLFATPAAPSVAAPTPNVTATFASPPAVVLCGAAPTLQVSLTSIYTAPHPMPLTFAGGTQVATVSKTTPATVTITGAPLACDASLTLQATAALAAAAPFATASFAPIELRYAAIGGKSDVGSVKLKMTQATCGAKPVVAVAYVAPASASTTVKVSIGGVASAPLALTGGKSGTVELGAPLDCTQAPPSVTFTAGTGAAKPWPLWSVVYSTALS